MPAFTNEQAHLRMYQQRYGTIEGAQRHSMAHGESTASQTIPMHQEGGGGEVAPSAGQPGGGNIFTRHYGPLPGWGWLAVVAGAGLVFYLYKQGQSASSTTSNVAGATPASAANSGGYTSSPIASSLQGLQSSIGDLTNSVNQLPTSGQIAQTISTTPSPIAVPNPTNAPITANNPQSALITAQYENVLGRMPDAQGAAYWQNVLLTQGPTAEAQQFNASAQKELSQKSGA
jgi:Domain of unknown function (DUF4214)